MQVRYFKGVNVVNIVMKSNRVCWIGVTYFQFIARNK